MCPSVPATQMSLATWRRSVLSGRDGLDYVPGRLQLLRIQNNSWNLLNPLLGVASLIPAAFLL